MTTAMTNISVDEKHHTIGAYGVCSKQAGFLNQDDVLAAFKEANIPVELYPTPISNSTALRRAMEDACYGNKSLRVESTGKFSKVVYSILRTNKDRIDREIENGIGVSDAEVSARVEADGTGGLSLVIKPDGHALTEAIKARFEFHRENYKCSEDISHYLTQRLFKHHIVKAINRPGHAGGFYFVPQGEGLTLLRKVDDIFKSLSRYTEHNLINGVKIYFMPMLTQVEDVLDAIVDSVIDDAEKVLEDLGVALRPETGLKARALASKAKSADELLGKLAVFSGSLNTAFVDLEERIKNLRIRIVMAQVASVE